MEAQLDTDRAREALVGAALSGDPEAFAAIYDRYADRVHDFCWSLLRDREAAAQVTGETFLVAARRLERLPHPAQLRAWLYGLARRRVLRHARLHAQPATAATPASHLPSRGSSAAPGGKRSLRQAVWQYAGGLGLRDRALVDLHVRQGLEGEELAAAVGTRGEAVFARLAYLRAEFEWAAGALLLARMASRDCTELAALQRRIGSGVTPAAARRFGEHVERCAACGERRLAVVSPWALLSAVPMVPAPPGLRAQVLGSARLHARGPVARPWRAALSSRAFATSVLLLLGVAGFWVGRQLVPPPEPVVSGTLHQPPIVVESSPGPQSEPPVETVEDRQVPTSTQLPASPSAPASRVQDTAEEPAPDPVPDPARLVLSAPEIVIGPDQDQATMTLANTGGTPLDWAAEPGAPWLQVEPVEGLLEPGASVNLRIRAQREGLPEGGAETALTVASTAGEADVPVRLAVERPPTIASKGASPAPLSVQGCEPDRGTVSAVVRDESGVAAVSLRWTGPGGISGSSDMVADGDGWTATLGPFPDPGEVRWVIVASDQRGNTAETGLSTVPVEPCADESAADTDDDAADPETTGSPTASPTAEDTSETGP